MIGTIFNEMGSYDTEQMNNSPGLELNMPVEHIKEINEETDRLKGVELIGNPEKDARNWHKQGENYSCAVVCQEFVAEQLLDREFSEDELIEFAKSKGWYDPESGTTISDIGKILESMGLNVERSSGLTLNDIAKALRSGDKVICGVNNIVLAIPEYSQMPGIRANHAVEVIGIKQTPTGTWVILNDPGVENGQGISIHSSTFLEAWKTGNNYAVIASKGELNK